MRATYGDSSLLPAWRDWRANTATHDQTCCGSRRTAAQDTLRCNPFKGTEEWQRDLWARLIARTRMEQSMSWVLPVELFGVLDKVGFDPPREVHLFGFSYVWTGLREMIQRACLEVATRYLHPFAAQEVLERHDQFVTSGRDDLLVREETNRLPIVIHWGQPGKEYAHMLGAIADAGAELHPDFVEGDSATAVRAILQHRVLAMNMTSMHPPSQTLAW